MSLEFGGRLDEHLLRDVPDDDDVCEWCDEELEDCECPAMEPDYEAIAEARAEARYY